MKSSPDITKQSVSARSSVDEHMVDVPAADHGREQRLILAMCQTGLTSEALDETSGILSGDIDWEYVLRVVRRNAVLTLFSWNVLNHFAPQLPDELRQDLTDSLHAYTRNNMFQTAKVGEIVRLFAASGIEAIPFKGPMLAIQAYGNPALRQYGDLDVLVQPRHFKAAVKVLREKGYEPLTSVSWIEKSNWYIGRVKDIYFVGENGSVKLELHWKLSGSHFGLPREMNGLWGRLEHVDLAGTEVPALSFNDLLIYLCLHGSRHSWERLAWVCDVHQLIRSEEDIDWDSVADDAKRFGCENVVTLGLRLIHEFFGFKPPRSSPFNNLMAESVFDTIVIEIRDKLLSATSKQIEIGDRYAYHLKLKERHTDRLKLHYHYLSWYLRLLVTPNELDKDVLNLPGYLSPLYYVTRPFRLIFSYLGDRSFRRSKPTTEKAVSTLK